MKVKAFSTDASRVSVSSAPSSSSHGSAQDDNEAYGDVYVWGEVICDSFKTNDDKNTSFSGTKRDILLPKLLQSNAVLDIQHLACGVKHAAFVTRQGEIFTWGEAFGGRLGHGAETEAFYPCLVESLSDIDFVACGEFHTCAVSTSGELYTWGDGAHMSGLLGHGTIISHWIPKRVSGPLEGLQISSVSCGTWHTALITVTGQLFTFGDGTFGALGHGNRERVLYPREVESLVGLKTIAVSCGVWHTAAVVEVIVTQSSASSGKLFTWGDGDKYRLGHGDKEARLEPTCVPSLIDYVFHKLACAHSLTIALTTSGEVFTMGSTLYGQLGNPHSDGKLPCLVQDKLANEPVKEVACGSYHVAVLTSRGEVYTWGKGANGRLGHSDVEDRMTPTIVVALKDKSVKHIACGSNFTAVVCQHKWVSSAEHSLCTTCKQAFGFTRKRHNCYNCGLAHCHSCSSRKSLKAALAPILGKHYRVCDSCFAKLNRFVESDNKNENKSALPLMFSDLKGTKAVSPNNSDFFKHLDTKEAKQGKKSDALSSIRSQQITSLLQLRYAALSVEFINDFGSVPSFSPKPSPPYSATPVSSDSSPVFSKSIAASLKKTNDLLNKEVQKLRAQVDSLRKRCDYQEYELQKSASKVEEATSLAAEESAKSRVSKDVIKSLTQQLKDIAEKLPQGVDETDPRRFRDFPSSNYSNTIHHSDFTGAHNLPNIANKVFQIHSIDIQPSFNKENFGQNPRHRGTIEATTEMSNKDGQSHKTADMNGLRLDMNFESIVNGEAHFSSCRPDLVNKDTRPLQNMDNGSMIRTPAPADNQVVVAEWIEQYEQGVYITLIALKDGSRDLKRVRFSRRRFEEQQAEAWWSDHRRKVYEKYNVRGFDRSLSSLSTQSTG